MTYCLNLQPMAGTIRDGILCVENLQFGPALCAKRIHLYLIFMNLDVV